MTRITVGFLAGVLCVSASGCATAGKESFWEKGERNTYLACAVPVIGCLPNLFFNVGKAIDNATSQDPKEDKAAPQDTKEQSEKENGETKSP